MAIKVTTQNVDSKNEFFLNDESTYVFVKSELKTKEEQLLIKKIGKLCIREKFVSSYLVKYINKLIMQTKEKDKKLKISFLCLHTFQDKVYITKVGNVDFLLNGEFITENNHTSIEEDNFINGKFIDTSKIYFNGFGLDRLKDFVIISYNKDKKIKNIVLKN